MHLRIVSSADLLLRYSKGKVDCLYPAVQNRAGLAPSIKHTLIATRGQGLTAAGNFGNARDQLFQRHFSGTRAKQR